MFNTELVTTGISGVSQTFGLQSIAGGKSVRSVSGRSPGEPKLLTISHQEVTRGVDANGAPAKADRHLVRIDHTEVNSGLSSTLTAYVVLEVPRDANHALADKQDAIERLYQLFISDTWGGLNKILNNEP